MNTGKYNAEEKHSKEQLHWRNSSKNDFYLLEFYLCVWKSKNNQTWYY